MNAPVRLDMDQLLESALDLPAELRELVAHRLWESLFPGDDADLSADQIAELDARLDDLEAGRAKLLDGEQVLARLRARAAAVAR